MYLIYILVSLTLVNAGTLKNNDTTNSNSMSVTNSSSASENFTKSCACFKQELCIRARRTVNDSSSAIPAKESNIEEPIPKPEPPEKPGMDDVPAETTTTMPEMSSSTIADPAKMEEHLKKLLAQLTNKLKNLEDSQDKLNQEVSTRLDRLNKKSRPRPSSNTKKFQKIVPQLAEQTSAALQSSNPKGAVDQWTNIQSIVDDPQQLSSITNGIITAACQHPGSHGPGPASPIITMNFIHNLPIQDPALKSLAYNTLADQLSMSELLQEQIYWKQLGFNSTLMNALVNDVQRDSLNSTTLLLNKMEAVKDQIRLKAAQPIKKCTRCIQNSAQMQAVNIWMKMVEDIPDNSNQLQINMQKIMLKSYRDENDLPLIFKFVFILPESQADVKDLAKHCLEKEMARRGHSTPAPAAVETKPVAPTTPSAARTENEGFKPSQRDPIVLREGNGMNFALGDGIDIQNYEAIQIKVEFGDDWVPIISQASENIKVKDPSLPPRFELQREQKMQSILQSNPIPTTTKQDESLPEPYFIPPQPQPEFQLEQHNANAKPAEISASEFEKDGINYYSYI